MLRISNFVEVASTSLR